MPATKKLGIVASIMNFIDGKVGKPFTHEEIHAELRRKFPDRNPAHMLTTVRTVVTPSGMKERGYSFTRKGKKCTAQLISSIENDELPHNGLSTEKGPCVAQKIKDAPQSATRLFRYMQDGAEELLGRSALLERDIHDLMEKHMECFLDIRLVAREFSTDDGRIDSLGLDKDNFPVIIEYKRNINETVVSQAASYLIWLRKRKADFKWKVLECFGQEVAQSINWSKIRILCVAEDFAKRDKTDAEFHKEKNIELIRYKYFSDDMLMLEWVIP